MGDERPASLMRCTFGDGPAVVFVALSDGCLGYPEHRTQALCLHHFHRSTPLGSLDVLRELDPDALAWYRDVAGPGAR